MSGGLRGRNEAGSLSLPNAGFRVMGRCLGSLGLLAGLTFLLFGCSGPEANGSSGGGDAAVGIRASGSSAP